MSIEEQKKIIEENCPLEKRLHSKRFLRHSFFKKKFKQKYKLIYLDFTQQMEALTKNVKHLELA